MFWGFSGCVIIFGASTITSIRSAGKEKFWAGQKLGGSGGFTDYLACSVSKWLSTRGSIKGLRCVISLTTLNSSGESISVPYLGFLNADKAGSIICPMWEMCSLWIL